MQKLIVIAFVLTVVGVFGPATPAAAYTPAEQAACQDDAFRVCPNAVPDEQKVKACMLANIRKLTPGCRRVFVRSRRR